MTVDVRAEAANPATSLQRLADLAASYPELRSIIAVNPSTYPDLLAWIRAQEVPAPVPQLAVLQPAPGRAKAASLFEPIGIAVVGIAGLAAVTVLISFLATSEPIDSSSGAESRVFAAAANAVPMDQQQRLDFANDWTTTPASCVSLLGFTQWGPFMSNELTTSDDYAVRGERPILGGSLNSYRITARETPSSDDAQALGEAIAAAVAECGQYTDNGITGQGISYAGTITPLGNLLDVDDGSFGWTDQSDRAGGQFNYVSVDGNVVFYIQSTQPGELNDPGYATLNEMVWETKLN